MTKAYSCRMSELETDKQELREELKIKNDQIKEANERNKETHVLMKDLHQLMADLQQRLPPPASSDSSLTAASTIEMPTYSRANTTSSSTDVGSPTLEGASRVTRWCVPFSRLITVTKRSSFTPSSRIGC